MVSNLKCQPSQVVVLVRRRSLSSSNNFQNKVVSTPAPNYQEVKLLGRTSRYRNNNARNFPPSQHQRLLLLGASSTREDNLTITKAPVSTPPSHGHHANHPAPRSSHPPADAAVRPSLAASGHRLPDNPAPSSSPKHHIASPIPPPSPSSPARAAVAATAWPKLPATPDPRALPRPPRSPPDPSRTMWSPLLRWRWKWPLRCWCR